MEVFILAQFFYENKGIALTARDGHSLTFGAHLHHHIEMVYMIEGSAKAFVDTKECIINSGDVFIVFPNQIHQYQKIDNEYFYLIIIPPDLCPEFVNIFKNKVPVSPVVKNVCKNPRIPQLFKSIVAVRSGNEAFHDTLIKGYFLVLFSELFEIIEFEETKSSDLNTIKEILRYCAENYRKSIHLDNISRDLYINKFYISHLFSQKLHMGFNEYIGMLRISDACRLIANMEMSITDIAYNVGFNSIRSFNRQFIKYVGVTPSQYKKNLL